MNSRRGTASLPSPSSDVCGAPKLTVLREGDPLEPGRPYDTAPGCLSLDTWSPGCPDQPQRSDAHSSASGGRSKTWARAQVCFCQEPTILLCQAAVTKDYSLAALDNSHHLSSRSSKVSQDGFFWGFSPWRVNGHLHPVSSQLSLCLYLNLLFWHGHQPDWSRTNSNDLIVTELPLQRPCLQMQSHSVALGVNTSTYEVGWGRQHNSAH